MVERGLEEQVQRGILSGITKRIDGNKEATLYQNNCTLDFIVFCCNVSTYGNARVCVICHGYAPLPKEMYIMDRR